MIQTSTKTVHSSFHPHANAVVTFSFTAFIHTTHVHTHRETHRGARGGQREAEERRGRLTGQAFSLSPVHRRAVCLEEMTRAAEEEMICLAPCKILPGTKTTALSSFLSSNTPSHTHTCTPPAPPPPLSPSSPSSSRLSIHRSSVTAGVQPIHHGSELGEPLGRVCVND